MDIKKGFTLVELLAVIVILGVILAIAVPAITGVINTTTANAFEADAKMVLKGINYKLLEEESYVIENIDRTILSDDFNLSVSNYSELTISRDGDGNPYILIVGQNKWEGLVACGTYNNIIVGDGSECLGPELADLSGASHPEMPSNMIPVKWDGTNWIKADINNHEGEHSWYNYDAYIWANAVTVAETGSGTGTDDITRQNRTAYLSAPEGSPISMDDILTFFVWIPRYKYAIPAGAGPREITVIFESKGTAKSTGTATDASFLTHPAFTFGTDEVDGIWVGKFESSPVPGNSCYTTPNTTNCNITNIFPRIVPNERTWRSIQVSNMFAVSRNVQNAGNIYGFPQTGIDTHMMKNTEWGAVTYLSHSRYGKFANPAYSAGADKEIYINNSSGYFTGRSGGAPGGTSVPATPTYRYSSTGYYTYDGKCAFIHENLPAPCNGGSVGQELTDKNSAYGASTTGNIYGVFDLSGGTHDFVLGNYNNTISSSGFGSMPASQYYNLYTTTSPTTSCDGGICYGHALSETSGWYDDPANFVSSGNPWLIRGGYYGIGESAGVWLFSYYSGGASDTVSFRVVLGLQG